MPSGRGIRSWTTCGRAWRSRRLCRPGSAGGSCCFPEAARRSCAATGRRCRGPRLRLAERLDLELVAVRATGLPDDLFAGAAENGITLAVSGMHALLATADLAFVASGTATLEAAVCGAPMVVVYKTSRASFAVGKLLVRVPWISLVNIVAGEEVVPELLQEEVNADRLESEGAALLESPERLRRMREGLARVSAAAGSAGRQRASRRRRARGLGFRGVRGVDRQ